MRNKKKTSISLCIAKVFVLLLSATVTTVCGEEQVNGYNIIGLSAIYSYNFHSTNFDALPAVPSCCPSFINGSGKGLAASFSLSLPLDKLFSIELLAELVDYRGVLKARESELINIDGSELPGVFEHTVDAFYSVVSLGGLVKVQPLPVFAFLFGLNVGVPIRYDYEQKEQIVDPPDKGYFLDTKTRIRNHTKGSIDNINPISVAILSGARLYLPMNASGSLYFCPEVFYSIGLNDVVSGISWRVNSLRFGLGLAYRFDF